ncbi:MAG: sel1 repeat family protein [Holosporaceae bacterium]|jgi:TPR repeat protein|nr:sel1 repeat family protein [Holosporaceae bacterium]
MKEMSRNILVLCVGALLSGCASNVNNKRAIQEPISEYEKLAIAEANKGNVDAQLELGRFYFKSKDYQKTYEWCLKAANQGNTKAYGMLSTMYYHGLYVKQDRKKAFDWALKAAINGDANGQLLIGSMYFDGDGVEKDYKKAFEWVQKSVAQNNYNALGMLAAFYMNGIYVPKNYKKAFEYASAAAEHNGCMGRRVLGMMYCFGYGIEKNNAKALEHFKRAFSLGDKAFSPSIIGEIYNELKNYPKAFEWYMKAAKNGDGIANFRVANFYKQGVYVKKDHNKFLEHMTKAADANILEALFLLGLYYNSETNAVNKDFVGRDDKKAFKYLLKAAELGSAWAQIMVGIMFGEGRGTEKNKELGEYWVMKGCTNDPALANKIGTKIQQELDKLNQKKTK